MNQSAIITLAIGEKHLADWQKYCAAGCQAYAEKHGLDLIVVNEPLDRSPGAASRSPAWQKCLVLRQEFAQKYAQVVVLDSDIVINPQTAPNILDQVPPEHVGGVISGSHLAEDLRQVFLERFRNQRYDYEAGPRLWQQDQAGFYHLYGLAPRAEGIIQTGVLVASPRHHQELFSSAYHAPGPEGGRGFEQIPLSHRILSAGVFRQIDTRFNSVFFETLVVHYPYLQDLNAPAYEILAKYAVRTQYANNFFLHFAYDARYMRYLVD